MPPEPQPFASTRDMLELAARGLGKVAAWDGVRGVTLVSVDEIAAMAGVLLAFGLVPVPPGATPPETLIHTPEKEA